MHVESVSSTRAEEGKLKCLHPMTSVGPSSRVKILESDGDLITIKADRAYFVGALVQVILNKQPVMGKVIACWEKRGAFIVQVHRCDF